ncbi:trypsin-like peptidase domain-containing protein [Neolewinella antarctica]|uniref:Serine protease Do n=1 Tax=Neolewinella antarctica TaxID=442734 RepID=A0ABX0X9F8_9BACT|nr:trypsin-like peptidase domain-containing protein [Neolewinella antarctica]NJC25871.1 serine protease Do [Neolewinella antarctica]
MLAKYVIQVATPFSTGTGVYLPACGLIVTNEHVVRDNANVVVGGEGLPEQLAPVVYLDAYYDLAFLRLAEPLDLPELPLQTRPPAVAASVLAIGQHFGHPLRRSEGHVLELGHLHHGIPFILHDAWQDAAHSGGPLFDAEGRLVGINMYDIKEGKGRALSLPASYLRESLDRFAEGEGDSAARCFDCQRVVFEVVKNPEGYCPNCGEAIVLPNMLEDYLATGIPATVEDIISHAGHDPRLARRGPNLWNIRQGSAIIQLAYHEDSGLVTGDAYLCSLPEIPEAGLFAYLLRENFNLKQLTFSTYGRDVILSLLIYDRYLTVEAALPRFTHLFERADYYDDILVERFGARWLGAGSTVVSGD